MATATERKKLNAEHYLAENGIRSLLERITAELVRFSPNDPLEFICERVEQLRSADPSVAALEHTRPRLVSVLGGPSSGKAQQCATLAKELGMVAIAPSELLRDEIKRGTAVGKTVGEMLHGSVTVPTEIITALIKSKIEHHQQQKHQGNSSNSPGAGFVLDGYPRTLEQALALERDVAELDVVIFLECDDETMRQRLAERVATGTPDANEGESEERLRYFWLHTYPVAQYFEALGKCRAISAMRAPEAIAAEVLKVVRD